MVVLSRLREEAVGPRDVRVTQKPWLGIEASQFRRRGRQTGFDPIELAPGAEQRT